MPDAARKIGLAAFYNSVFSDRGFSLAPHHYPIIAGLEDERIDNLLYLAPAGTGKSLLLCSAFPAWVLGHDPAQTILSVSAGASLPVTFMQTVMQVIQHSKVYRELFPDVLPAQELGWSLQRGLFVTGHHRADQDASYMSCGLSSKALTGLHCRTMILDDLHDKENSSTVESRAKVVQTYYDTLMGRSDPRGCRRVAAGRWWAKDDLYQELISNGDWVVLELPAERPGERKLYYDVYVPHGLDCIYSERCEKAEVQNRGALYTKYRYYYAAIDRTGQGFYWPDLKQKRRDYEVVKRRQPRTAAINYCGDMTGGTDAVFQKEDFQQYMPPPGMEFGISHNVVRAWCDGMKGEIEDAWDTAMGQIQSESITANLTGLMVPCQQWHCGEDASVLGACDFHYDLYLLDFWSGDVGFGKLVEAFRTRHALWHPKRMNIEEKQSGISLLNIMRSAKLPVHPIKVVEGKVERAVNAVLSEGELPIGGGAASVQGWARMGRIHVPMGAAWVDGFLDKVCEFKGGSRFSDEFDTLVHLCTRAILRSRKTGRIGRMQQNDVAGDDPRMEILNAFGQIGRQVGNPQAEGILNPFEGMCGGGCGWMCVKDNAEWCRYHERRTTALEGCGHWAAKGSVKIRQVEEQRGLA